MTTTRLHKACRNGKLEEIKMLLQDENWLLSINSKVGTFGYTPLHEAVYARKHDVVKLLLDLGADVNSRSDKNYTALHIAASLDARDCIEVLLEYNANTSLIDDFNETPYETAKRNNRGFLGCLIFSADVLNSLKECRNEEFLNYLKNIKPEDVTQDCFEKCLKVAIDQDNCTAVGELMLLKPCNVKSCLSNALKKQNCYKSTLLLLLCYAVEKHINVVLKYICETNCSENIELDHIEWSDLKIPTSLLYLLRSYMIEIKDYFVYPIRIGCSPLVKNYEGIQFILSNFFCDKKKLVANWGNLSLPCFHEEWQNVCMVIKLKNVILSFNCIESISSNKITFYLKSVQRLNLSSNNLKEIPPDLLKLPMLRNLNLSSNKLKHLPDVKEWSQYFTTLSLDNNLLESFPTNVEQVPIKHLYISNNKLASIPEGICNLKYLETLKICGNVNIHALPLNMGNLTKLTLLDKTGLKIYNPPVIKNLNKTEDIMRYLIALKRAAEPYYTMKLMIVGFEAQGKTTLLKRLQDNTSYNENQPTEGIDIQDVSIGFGRKKSFNFRIWDFAGQEDYYATHPCFLFSSSLYLLVWDVTKRKTCSKLLKPWLENLLARNEVFYVIIVGTKLDLLNGDINDACKKMTNQIEAILEKTPSFKRLRAKDIHFSSRVKIIFVSLNPKFPNYNKNIDSLKTQIYLLAESMSFDGKPGGAKIMGMLVPQSYQKLEAEIINIRNAKEKNGEVPIISRADFVKIGKSLKCNADKFEDDDFEAATKVLLDTGTILYFEGANEDLYDIIFLSPSWVCKLMAKFITVDCVHAFIKNGILERNNIPLILGRDWGSDNQGTIRKYLKLLWRFQVACEIDDHRILVPSKLPKISTKHTFDSSSLLTRYYFFNCVPYGFWARFITRFLLITKEMLSNPKIESKPKVLSVESVQKNNCDSVLCEEFLNTNGTQSLDQDHTFSSESKTNCFFKVNFPIMENCPIPSLHHLESDVMNVLQEIVDCVILKLKANTSEGVAEKDSLTFSYNADNEVNQNDSKNIDFTDSLNAATEFISKQDHEKNQSEEDDEVNAQFIKELSNNDEEYEEYFNDCNELAYLLDKGYLSCWNKGIIFNHPQLYFSIQQLHSTVKPDQETIEIRVSKSPLGYRVLGYIVDHIRTLLEEWYEGLLNSGTVVSSLACPVCTSLGLNQPYTFNISTAFEKIYKSSEENVCKVICQQFHSPRTVNIEEFCPDLTFQDLPKTMKFTSKDFQCEQNEKYKLGEGQYGKVYSGKCKNKINSAIKFYKFNMVNSDELSSSLNQFYKIRQEVIMLSKLRHHPYIIQFLGFSLKPELCVVMERASHGSLSTVIHKKHQVIPRIVKFRICQQIASAIAFMHKKYIIHRDIKSDNILLFSLNHNAKINIKLTDFGTANFMSPSGMKTLYGTKGYTAPEMILYQSSLDEYNSSVDIYSFGIVIYELIAYKRPFHDVSEGYEVDQNVKMGFRPIFYDILHAFYGLVHLTKLMISMWHQEPSKRPQAKDALSVLLSPTFQLVFGLKTLSSIHNPRELCYVEKYNQIWVACDDKDDKGQNIIVIDMESFKDVKEIQIERTEFTKSLQNRTELCLQNIYFNISSITSIDKKYVCVVLRGLHDVLLVYKAKKYSVSRNYPMVDLHVVSISANSEWVCLGFHNGRCSKVKKNDFLKRNMLKYLCDFQLNSLCISGITSPVTSLVLLLETAIWSVGRYIAFCNLKNEEEGMKPCHMNRNVQEIVYSFDETLFFISFQCSPEIYIHNAITKEPLHKFSCCDDIPICSTDARNVDLRVTCMCSVDNMLWVGTGSGHILIYEVHKKTAKTILLQTLHPYTKELRKLVLIPTERHDDVSYQERHDDISHHTLYDAKYLIVSTGKEINKNAFEMNTFFFNGRVPKDETAFNKKLYEPRNSGENDGKVIIVWHVLPAHQYKNLLLD